MQHKITVIMYMYFIIISPVDFTNGIASIFFQAHLNINPGQISVSGLSSGACMASQFHVIHSGTIMGAAMFAGGKGK